MSSLRYCVISNKAVIKELIRDSQPESASEEDRTQEYDKIRQRYLDDLENLEITYDKVKKLFEEAREYNKIESLRETFHQTLETTDEGW